jgi:hypothetical protein
MGGFSQSHTCAAQADHIAALILNLRPLNNDDELLERDLHFEEGTKLKLGRASSTESKHLLAASDNGWISCPVMSRDHAIVECRLVDEVIVLPSVTSNVVANSSTRN